MKYILLLILLVSVSYGDITVNSFMNSIAGSIIIGYAAMIFPVAIVFGLVWIWWKATDQDGKEKEKFRADREKAKKEWDKKQQNSIK